MSHSDIEYLNELIQRGSVGISDESWTMESMKLALGNLFQIPDYDDRIITQILEKLDKLSWDITPQQTELNFLRNGIQHSKAQLNSLLSSEGDVLESLDKCLMIYRIYCYNR